MILRVHESGKSFGDPGNTQERAEGGRFGAAQGGSGLVDESPGRDKEVGSLRPGDVIWSRDEYSDKWTQETVRSAAPDPTLGGGAGWTHVITDSRAFSAQSHAPAGTVRDHPGFAANSEIVPRQYWDTAGTYNPGGSNYEADRWRAGLGEDDQHVLTYWESSFQHVEAIRSNPDDSVSQRFEQLVKDAPLTDGPVYRGIPQTVDWSERVGRDFRITAPVSGSTDVTQASSFGNALMRIEGAPAHLLGNGMNEAVMLPGRYEVVSVGTERSASNMNVFGLSGQTGEHDYPVVTARWIGEANWTPGGGRPRMEPQKTAPTGHDLRRFVAPASEFEWVSGSAKALISRVKYSDDQPRDENGRFASSGTPAEQAERVAAITATTTPANYRDTWKPSMSPAEGHAWSKAAGSKYTDTVVHVTDFQAVDGIRGTGFHTEPVGMEMHENGAYFATDPATAEFYDYKGSAAVSAAVVVQNPLELDLTSAIGEANSTANALSGSDFRAEALKAAGIEDRPLPSIIPAANFTLADSAKETTDALKAAGYDGVHIVGLKSAEDMFGVNESAVGGNQLVVFDTMQATTIGVTKMISNPDIGYDEDLVREAFAKLRVKEFNDDQLGRGKSFGDPGNTQERAEGGRFGSAAGGHTASNDLFTEPTLGPGQTWEQASNIEGDAQAMKAANAVARAADMIAAAKDNPKLAEQLANWQANSPIGMNSDTYANPAAAYALLTHGPWSDAIVGQPTGPYAPPKDPVEAGAHVFASVLQDAWARSASDSVRESLALQYAVAEKFGIDPGASGLLASDYPRRDVADEYMKNSGEVVRAYVSSVYDATQSYLKDQGVTSVELARGMSPNHELDAIYSEGQGSRGEVTMNPASSWSTDVVTAERFGVGSGTPHYDAGFVLVATVPAENILSLPMTGSGCLNEREVTVIGKPLEASVYSYDYVHDARIEAVQSAHPDVAPLALAPREWVVPTSPSSLGLKYSPDQARDDHGRFSETSGGSTAAPDRPGQNPASAAIRQVAAGYMATMGRPFTPDHTYVQVDVARAQVIAALYDKAKDEPTNPTVAAAYQAFKDETLAQYEYLRAQGYQIEMSAAQGEPYKNSAAFTQDIQENQHLTVLPTTGPNGEISGVSPDNPLLEKTGIQVAYTDGRPYDLTYNDAFRWVHDTFGHAMEGNQTGPRGEENAWREHVQMYSTEAARAMTTETRGQNSWMNYGPGNPGGDTPLAERSFPDQKITLLPVWVSRLDGQPPAQKTRVKYSDDQPRDEHGRFSEGAGSSDEFVAAAMRGAAPTDDPRWGERTWYHATNDPNFQPTAAAGPIDDNGNLHPGLLYVSDDPKVWVEEADRPYLATLQLADDAEPMKDFIVERGEEALILDISKLEVVRVEPAASKTRLSRAHRVKYSEDQPRDDSGRWASGDGNVATAIIEDRTFTPLPGGPLAARLQEPGSGFSVNREGKDMPKQGWAVADGGFEQAFPVDEHLAANIEQYQRDHADLLMQGDKYFGAWHDDFPGSRNYGMAVLDVSHIEATRGAATGYGLANDQEGIYDLAGEQAIDIRPGKVRYTLRVKYSEDEPRDDHGRWTTGGGEDVAVSADQHAGVAVLDRLTPEAIAATAYASLQANGGATIDTATGTQPDHGTAVASGYSQEEVLHSQDVTPAAIQAYAERHAEQLAAPGNYLGLWESDGLVHMDVSEVRATQAEAEAAGITRGELAGYDLASKEEIPFSTGSDPNSPIETTSVDVAARALYEGKFVDLEQERGVSTLLDKLAAIGQEAKAAGVKAGVYDLGKVTIQGTNIFMNENLGVPRAEMPQFTGTPTPGSPADGFPRDSHGEVDLSQAFIEHLSGMGVSVSNEVIPAENLRATQSELDGVKVAGMASAIEAGTYRPTERSIWTTKDNYVLDGHHTWAAVVAVEYTDNSDKQLFVRSNVIDMPITDALREAKTWTAMMGIGTRAVGKLFVPFRVKYNEDQERDDHGRWTSGGSTASTENRVTERDQLAPATTTVEDQKLLAYIQEKTDALNLRADEYSQKAWGYAPGSQASLSQQRDVADMLAKNDNVRELGGRIAEMAKTNDALATYLFDRAPFRDDTNFNVTVNGDMKFGGIDRPDNPVLASAYFNTAMAQYGWADSAVQDTSVALQLSANETFGLGADTSQLATDQASNPFSDALVQATYDHTQEELKAAGIENVTLFRGMAWGQEWNTAQVPDWAQHVIDTGEIRAGQATAPEAVTLNPLSSWSASEQVAQHFTDKATVYHSVSAKLEASVPASRIFSTPFTGPGCMSEMEYVVLGSGTVQVTAS